MHKELLGFDSHWVDLEFYWLFINGKPYGYVLALDDTKSDMLKNRDPKYKFDNENDCLIKSKVWSEERSGNMEYHTDFENLD